MEFTNLSMGSMSISEYYNKFIELMRFAPEVVPTETIKAQRSKQGLTLTFQGKLGGVTFETLDEVYGHAAHLYGIKGREIESSEGEEKKKSESGNGGFNGRKENKGNFGKGNDGQETNVRGNGDQENSEKPKRLYFCRRCEKNHPRKDCEGSPVTCHYCQKLGHREYECFKKESDVKAGKVHESKNSFKPSQFSGPQVGTSSNGENVPNGRVFVMNNCEHESSE
ncbi:protein lin-28 homolog A-like [Chenopodium quinoa]|uniref:protein lin-28 homolog A-like n=1 Tax=Chenopodium quinoa TaxID=63459 RepID=UPI000B793AE7|nr:protein lin-28 homolog A-like [Chenopodium quinoa]